MRSRPALAFFLVGFLFGCSTVTKTSSWRDERYTGGPVRQVLVLGVAENARARRLFEDEIARQLAGFGVEAVPSYRLVPGDAPVSKERLEAKLRESKLKTILVGQVVERRRETVEDPGDIRIEQFPAGRRGWHRYYSESWEITRDPTYTRERDIVTVETNLYDAKTDALIWSASYEAILEGSLDPVFQDLATATAEGLKSDGLLR